MTVDATTIAELLAGAPRNWGRWGEDDEIGSLNFQTPEEVLRGVRAVRSGKVFTLGVPIADPAGDPIYPGRAQPMRFNTQDKSDYVGGRVQPQAGGSEWADDYLGTYLQGSTQFDALGHMWVGDQIYNGHDALESTTGAMTRCGVDKLARKGIVGRGILIDVAGAKGVEALPPAQPITLADIEEALERQNTPIEPHDNVLLHTGWIATFYRDGAQAFFTSADGGYQEPGLTYSPELIEWFHRNEVVSYSTDTLANECTPDPATGFMATIHIALMANLGILFSEVVEERVLAADCAADGQYTFLYSAAPMHVVNGAGAPVNPVVIK